ncbi:MAG: patatin-like phospholipase family protein [Burkholderiaceae bacterium]|nr:patatin-like phospholipase family protein [Burkholderiaceae bacterium]
MRAAAQTTADGGAAAGPPRRSRIGIALAGGGPLGAAYEIGALAALADAVRGFDLNEADVYVGVSAGAFIAAGLVNGFTPRAMARLFIEEKDAAEGFDPGVLLRPAWGEFARRLRDAPALLAGTAWRALRRPAGAYAALQPLGRLIPTGLFDGAQIDRHLAQVFSQPGRSNDFRRLRRKLFVVATDLDTGEAVAFGAPGFDHVPVSRAVQASAALPGVFPPVAIDGRHFVDGALRKTLHASVALEQGVDLLFCLNPLVPYDARALPAERAVRSLADGGLPVVLAQTFRALIHSRLEVGMARYRTAYPRADIVLLQPSRADAEMFFTNLFSYATRRRLCEHAYQRTRADLWARRHRLAPLLARHGMALDEATLRDPAAALVPTSARRRAPSAAAAVRALAHTLEELEHRLATARAR